MLAQILMTNGLLEGVMDGGAIYPIWGSFGWVIAIRIRNKADNTMKTIILWEGNGYARGHPMDSDRAEPYGRLALFIFVKRYAEFMGIRKSKRIFRTYCDNSHVIKYDHEENDPYYSPGTTMKPNWDIYTQVDAIKKDITTVFEDIKPCIHIKGHQDNDKDRNKLPWPVQLNCRCDDLATEILDSYDATEQDRKYPLQVCKEYLVCNSTWITSNPIKYIKDLTNEQPLHAYHKE